MYLNVGLLSFNTIFETRLIATYDVFELPTNPTPKEIIERLIATYDVFEFKAQMGEIGNYLD